MINFENLISKHCLESVDEKRIDNLKLKGYTVIETLKSDRIDLITMSAEFITNPEGWLDRFNIVVLPTDFSNFLVLVSPECPEVYIAEPSDIVELAESYLSEKRLNSRCQQGTTSTSSWSNSTWAGPWTSIQNEALSGKYNPGTLIYGGNNDLYITNVDGTFTQITSGIDNITYSAANINEPGKISVNLNCKC